MQTSAALALTMAATMRHSESPIVSSTSRSGNSLFLAVVGDERTRDRGGPAQIVLWPQSIAEEAW